MLYIRNWDKFNLDKSSISLLSYYANQLSGLNHELKVNIRSQLLNILDIIDDLQTRVINAKERVRKGIEDVREILDEYGYNADKALEQAEELLDRAEEDLTDIRNDVNTRIEDIDCSQYSGCTEHGDAGENCNYSDDESGCSFDCGEGSNSCDHSSGCAGLQGLPGAICAGDYDSGPWCYEGVPSCGFTDIMCAQICNVASTPDCLVDKNCGVGCGLQCDDEGKTGCSWVVGEEGGNYWGRDDSCSERACTYSGEDARDCSNVPENCTFNCTYYSDCVEAPVPQNCNHTCADNGCNFGGVCTYQSISVDDYRCEENCCIWAPSSGCGDEAPCVGGDDYDPSCDELSCDEACTYGCSYSCSYSCDEDCSESCGEECNQSSDCSDVTCDGGDDYDPSCDECSIDDDDDSGGDGGDDGGNVICTYIIHRLFNDDPYYLKCSEDNVRIGLRHGGLPAKAFKEYYDGLGLDIIECLKKEDDSYLRRLWDSKIFKVWMTLRTDAKEGVRLYTQLVKEEADRYNIDYYGYQSIVMWFKLMSLA